MRVQMEMACSNWRSHNLQEQINLVRMLRIR